MRKTPSLAVRTGLIGLSVALGSPGTAIASGFALPEISTAGIGTANAMVANPVDPGAFAYNPAAMGFHGKSSLALGTLFVAPSFEVDNAAGTQESEGADWLVAPLIQGALRLNERWWIGFGANAPFGLETRWGAGTFRPLAGELPAPPPLPEPTIPLSPQPLQSKLEITDLVPTATFRVNEALSVSAGLDYYWAKSAVLNSSLAALEGDGTGWGYNLGFLLQQGPFSLGANYHSAATIEVSGDYRPRSRNLVILERLAPAENAELDLNLPWRLQLGLRYAFTERLAIEADWTRTGWSEFDEIQVWGKRSGALLQEDLNDWSDANAYRFGVTYQWRPETVLRFGYSFDETGQPERFFSPRVPDNDRHLFGIGIGQDLGNGWAVDAGYMYVRFEDRDYRSATPYTGGGHINGTDALDGRYEASAHLVGLDVRKSF